MMAIAAEYDFGEKAKMSEAQFSDLGKARFFLRDPLVDTREVAVMHATVLAEEIMLPHKKLGASYHRHGGTVPETF